MGLTSARTIEIYVIIALVLTILIWSQPRGYCVYISSYLSASTILVLLNVMFLQKVFGGRLTSIERSLLLFICNVVQIVFTFATWYQLKGDFSQADALFQSILVFATIGYPKGLPLITSIQIATDFVLLAMFLAYLIGRVGAK